MGVISIRQQIWSVGLAWILVTGCHSKSEPPAQSRLEESAAAPALASSPDPQSASKESPPEVLDAGEVMASARQSLADGNVDEAAARLAQLQIQGAAFTAPQAKDYRTAMSEAYERAIEAVQRGDPRGQAALQLLRAAGPR